jgi:hypothetical protein
MSEDVGPNFVFDAQLLKQCQPFKQENHTQYYHIGELLVKVVDVSLWIAFDAFAREIHFSNVLQESKYFQKCIRYGFIDSEYKYTEDYLYNPGITDEHKKFNQRLMGPEDCYLDKNSLDGIRGVIVMNYVVGKSIKTWMHEQKTNNYPDLDLVSGVFLQISTAHRILVEKGVYMGTFDAQNILVDDTGSIVATDLTHAGDMQEYIPILHGTVYENIFHTYYAILQATVKEAGKIHAEVDFKKIDTLVVKHLRYFLYRKPFSNRVIEFLNLLEYRRLCNLFSVIRIGISHTEGRIREITNVRPRYNIFHLTRS